MTRASFRQADVERILRAAAKTGAAVQVDLRSLVVTIFPGAGAVPKPLSPLAFAQDGKEDWSDLNEIPGVHSRNPPPAPVQPPFDHRERSAMERLVAIGVGERLPSGGIRSYGPHTQKKLIKRGYIEVFHQQGDRFADDEISLTKRGMVDWKALKKHWELYPSL